MSKFKIKVIAHQLKGKKVAKFGEIVDESQLTSSSDDLVKRGFIEPFSDADAKAKADADAKVSTAASNAAKKLENKSKDN